MKQITLLNRVFVNKQAVPQKINLFENISRFVFKWQTGSLGIDKLYDSRKQMDVVKFVLFVRRSLTQTLEIIVC